MVHRTDIAGRNMGRASPGHDGICCAALNGAFLENDFSLRRQECCRLLVAAVLPDHAIYLKLQDPRRR
jgi:hypothetical protein